jgi:hypothetical protein
MIKNLTSNECVVIAGGREEYTCVCCRSLSLNTCRIEQATADSVGDLDQQCRISCCDLNYRYWKAIYVLNLPVFSEYDPNDIAALFTTYGNGINACPSYPWESGN